LNFNEEHNKLVQKAYFGWWFVIVKYSKCQLIDDNDILVAISGIAKVMGPKEPSPGSLMEPMANFEPLNLYFSKSSNMVMASIKGGIGTRCFSSHANEKHFYIAEITNAYVELVGDDETSQVGKGCISLRARTLDVKWRFANSGEHISCDIEGEGFNGLVTNDETGARREAKESKTNGLVFVPILFMSGWKDPQKLRCEGLVLRKVNEECHYVRCGKFDAFHKHHTTIDFRRYQEQYVT
jgi:hypothetical protein